MNKAKKIIFCWCFLSLGLKGLQAQSINFKFADGSTSEYAVAEVRSITFTNDIMHLNKKDGSSESWPLSSIDKYKYTNLTTGISLPNAGIAGDGLVIFPNPASADITIGYTITNPDKVSIELFDLKGQLIRQIEQEQSVAGKYTVNWNGKDSNGNVLPTGTYVCHVNAGGIMSSQKILIIK